MSPGKLGTVAMPKPEQTDEDDDELKAKFLALMKSLDL